MMSGVRRPADRSLADWLTLALPCIVGLLLLRLVWGFALAEDAYIFLRYSSHLASGHGKK